MLSATFITRVFERGGAFSIAARPHDGGLRSLRRASSCRRATCRATCCSPTRSTRSSSPRSTLDGQAGRHPAPAGLALQDRSGNGGGTRTATRSRSTRRARATATDPEGDRRDEGRPGPVDVRDQVSRVGPLPGARLRPRRRALHRAACSTSTGRAGPARARDQSGPAANILTLTSDKQEYKVGETAVVQLPEAAQGRALLTLENGSAHPRASLDRGERRSENRVSIPITPDMAPNVYVAVTLVQPHAGKTNDRPIRLYGVIPLKVSDPATKIAPVVTTAAEWKPQSKASLTVSETAGRAMNYTLAVVDEGLLGLTNFKTPNLHARVLQARGAGRLHLGPVRRGRRRLRRRARSPAGAGRLGRGDRRPTRTKASRAFRRW